MTQTLNASSLKKFQSIFFCHQTLTQSSSVARFSHFSKFTPCI